MTRTTLCTVANSIEEYEALTGKTVVGNRGIIIAPVEAPIDYRAHGEAAMAAYKERLAERAQIQIDIKNATLKVQADAERRAQMEEERLSDLKYAEEKRLRKVEKNANNRRNRETAKSENQARRARAGK